MRQDHYTDRLQAIYRSACALDVAAFKPGNVSWFSAGHDGQAAADFVTSARVSAAALTDAALGVGERIYRAVAATQRAVGSNTNLGIVLLAAPILHALRHEFDAPGLRPRLRQTLHRLDVTDAQWTFRAIALADPAGLGHRRNDDVHQPARVSLSQAMAAAAVYDRIAFQYQHDYVDVFEFAAPLLRQLSERWQDRGWAAVGVYLALLACIPDSHIARKHGGDIALAVRQRAQPLAVRLNRSAHPQHLLRELYFLDREFKRAGINPGTTADLTVATLMTTECEALLRSRIADRPATVNYSGSRTDRCFATQT